MQKQKTIKYEANYTSNNAKDSINVSAVLADSKITLFPIKMTNALFVDLLAAFLQVSLSIVLLFPHYIAQILSAFH